MTNVIFEETSFKEKKRKRLNSGKEKAKIHFTNASTNNEKV